MQSERKWLRRGFLPAARNAAHSLSFREMLFCKTANDGSLGGIFNVNLTNAPAAGSALL